MIYQATLYVQGKPNKFLFWTIKPTAVFLSSFLVDAENYDKGMDKVKEQIEVYKSINPKFLTDKEIIPFLHKPL